MHKRQSGLRGDQRTKAINQIAQEHVVHRTQVNQWKKELRAMCLKLGGAPNGSH